MAMEDLRLLFWRWKNMSPVRLVHWRTECDASKKNYSLTGQLDGTPDFIAKLDGIPRNVRDSRSHSLSITYGAHAPCLIIFGQRHIPHRHTRTPYKRIGQVRCENRWNPKKISFDPVSKQPSKSRIPLMSHSNSLKPHSNPSKITSTSRNCRDNPLDSAVATPALDGFEDTSLCAAPADPQHWDVQRPSSNSSQQRRAPAGTRALLGWLKSQTRGKNARRLLLFGHLLFEFLKLLNMSIMVFGSWLEFPLQNLGTWVLCKIGFSMVLIVLVGPCAFAFCSQPSSCMFLEPNMGWVRVLCSDYVCKQQSTIWIHSDLTWKYFVVNLWDFKIDLRKSTRLHPERSESSVSWGILDLGCGAVKWLWFRGKTALW